MSALSRTVDLNADLGEEVTDDAGQLAVVTSANGACGYHAGTAATMTAVCDEAVRLGVAVGAQVSYADREHFGRRALDVAGEVLREQVADQVGTLDVIARRAGTSVDYLKPHGALYHRVLDDEEQAAAVLAGSGALPVLGMAGRLLTLAEATGGRRTARGSPTAATAPTAGYCRVTGRARCSTTPTRSPPARSSWPPRSTRSVSTATAWERWRTRSPVDGRWRVPD